jgi:hypothetical protein
LLACRFPSRHGRESVGRGGSRPRKHNGRRQERKKEKPTHHGSKNGWITQQQRASQRPAKRVRAARTNPRCLKKAQGGRDWQCRDPLSLIFPLQQSSCSPAVARISQGSRLALRASRIERRRRCSLKGSFNVFLVPTARR